MLAWSVTDYERWEIERGRFGEIGSSTHKFMDIDFPGFPAQFSSVLREVTCSEWQKCRALVQNVVPVDKFSQKLVQTGDISVGISEGGGRE